MDYSKCTYISWGKYEESPEIKVNNGDILLVKTGSSYGKCAFVESLFEKATINPQFVVLRHISINPEFLTLILQSQYARKCYNEFVIGTAIPTFTQEKLSNMFIPLPPIYEQNRIISQVSKLMVLISHIAEESLFLFKNIEHVKSKILELAITGRLVPQNPDDEPAAELLRRINPEAQIVTDNGHYPERWVSVRLKDCVTTMNGLWTGKKPPYKSVPVIRNANFTKNFSLDFSNIAYIEVEEKSFEKRKLLLNDLIIEKSGGSDNFPVGRPVIFDLADGEYSYSNFTMRMRVLFGFPLIPKYLYYVLVDGYNKGEMKEMQTQTTGLHNLIMDKYMDRIVNIPPIEEQSRIVAKIEELFSMLDAVKDALQA